MSDKNIAHKQLIVAKCYKLALLDCRDAKHKAHIHGTDYPSHKIDEGAMYYLDRIMKAANRWEEAESSAKSEKDSYERNR
jgi:hypothetical protein|tara:strand:+ start:348 stop:587 length:240 start_codon:yes stop_codon:yes gene_type:complete